jgi:two-component system response regulator AlgR
MKVLVVDDEKLARERLIRMVGTIGDYEVVGEACNGGEAVEKSLQLEPDIVLLDIRMPGMDGLEAGHKISELPSPPAMVYCTAFGEHAMDAFDVNAAGYLLKPVRREALVDTLGKIGKVNKVQLRSVTGEDESGKPKARTHISAKTRRGIELIPLSEIRFFLADHKYVTVRHQNGEVLIDDTLRDLEEEFGNRVVRIHRNALVMMDHLEGLERDSRGHYQVRMRGVDEKLDVSRRHVSGQRRLVQSL